MQASPSQPVLFTIRVTRRLAVAAGAGLLLAIALAVALPLALIGDGRESSSASGDTGAVMTAALVPGATIHTGSAVVAIKNTWGGGQDVNVVVSVDGAGAGERGAWAFVLEDGTALAPAIADWPNGEAYLRLERGIPAGHTLRELRYAPDGRAPVAFEVP
jgi:hypothetical protein